MAKISWKRELLEPVWARKNDLGCFYRQNKGKTKQPELQFNRRNSFQSFQTSSWPLGFAQGSLDIGIALVAPGAQEGFCLINKDQQATKRPGDVAQRGSKIIISLDQTFLQ